MFPYREGYLGGSKDNYYGNDDGSFVPTKFAYMLFDWEKDSRAKVTFMSDYNGNSETSVNGLEMVRIGCRLQLLLLTHMRREMRPSCFLPQHIVLLLRLTN